MAANFQSSKLEGTGSMKVWVVICTWNRAKLLDQTLTSMQQLRIPEGVEWELLIVDNNSTDHTREVIAAHSVLLPIRSLFERRVGKSFALNRALFEVTGDDTQQVVHDFISTSGLDCRYVSEPLPGHSHARNRGVQESLGEIIAFTDDDVVVDPYWIEQIVQKFREKQVACVGGKISPIWEKPCPKWLKKEFFAYIALLDLGDQEMKLSAATLWGANLAVRSSYLKERRFNTHLGPKGKKLYRGEEAELIQGLINEGKEVLYCPSILVHHFIPASRIKKSYFRKWIYDHGELQGIEMRNYPFRNVFGIPLYFIRQTNESLIQYLKMLLIDPGRAFRQQLFLFYNLGRISGRIKYRVTLSRIQDPLRKREGTLLQVSDQNGKKNIEGL